MKKGTQNDEFLTPSRVARMLDKSEGCVRGYATRGMIPCTRTSTGLRLFRRADIEKFIEQQRASGDAA